MAEGIFAVAVAPACFRWVPPDAAGRLFRSLTRALLLPAAAVLLTAAALRALALLRGIHGAVPVACDFTAILGTAMALTALPSFDRARERALREGAPGGPPDAPAILRSFALLRGIRALALLSALGALGGAVSGTLGSGSGAP